MLKVNFDDLESLDFNMNLEVTYNDKPFTGIAFEDTPHYYNECEYVDGYRHGRDYCIYKSGKLKSEDFYKNGEFIEGKEWYENGQIREDRKDPYLKQWYENGVMYRDTDYSNNSTVYRYESSNIRDVVTYEKTKNCGYQIISRICYAENQNELFRMNKNHEDSNKHYVKSYNNFYILFNNDEMKNSFDAMCSDFYFLEYIRLWLIDFLERDFENAYTYLEKMLYTENLYAKYEAILICGCAKISKAIPILETFLNNDEVPKMYIDKFTLAGRGFGRSIGQQAKQVIDELEKL